MCPFRRWRKRLAVSWHRSLLVVFLGQLTTAVGFSSVFPLQPICVQSRGSATGADVKLLAGPVGLPEPTSEVGLA